jgi:anti-sigma factor RsiW
MTAQCRAAWLLLNQFVDGELTGADRLRVARHLETCRSCADEAESLRALGDSLRGGRGIETQLPIELAGLAASVVSRSRAERALSWQARLARACEDWHWAIVGAGSCAATLISTLLVSAILTFGPAPERRDSVSGVYKTLDGTGAVLASYAEARSADILLLDYERRSAAWVAASRAHTESDLVGDLADMIAPRGHRAGIRKLDPSDQLKAEALLNEIVRLRLAEPYFAGRPPTSQVAVATAISWRSAGTVHP